MSRSCDAPELAFGAVAPDPLARAADTNFGGLGRRRQRPLLIDNPLNQHPPLVQAESRVSVELHPVSSLGLSRLAALSLQGGPDEPTSSGTTGRPGPPPSGRAGRPRSRRPARAGPVSH